MKRLNTNVSAFNRPLQETPEILHAVRVYVTVDVLLSMIDYFMRVIAVQSFIGKQLIGYNFSALANILSNDLAEFPLAASSNVMHANLARIPFKQAEDDFFSARTATVYLLLAFVLVHESRRAADKVSSASTVPDILLIVP